MKHSKSFVITVAVLIIGVGFAWRHIKETEKGPVLMLPAKDAYWLLPRTNSPTPHPSSNETPRNLGSNY